MFVFIAYQFYFKHISIRTLFCTTTVWFDFIPLVAELLTWWTNKLTLGTGLEMKNEFD